MPREGFTGFITSELAEATAVGALPGFYRLVGDGFISVRSDRGGRRLSEPGGQVGAQANPPVVRRAVNQEFDANVAVGRITSPITRRAVSRRARAIVNKGTFHIGAIRDEVGGRANASSSRECRDVSATERHLPDHSISRWYPHREAATTVARKQLVTQVELEVGDSLSIQVERNYLV